MSRRNIRRALPDGTCDLPLTHPVRFPTNGHPHGSPERLTPIPVSPLREHGA